MARAGRSGSRNKTAVSDKTAVSEDTTTSEPAVVLQDTSSGGSPAVIAVGDIVLATHSGQGQWESESIAEPALVIKVNCRYDSFKVDDDDDNKEKVTMHDGVLVKFQVSNTRLVLPLSFVRPVEKDDDDDDNKDDDDKKQANDGTNNRRSSRVARNQQTQQQKSPATTASKDDSANGTGTAATASSSSSRRSRGLVTPSPTVVNDDNGSDESVDMTTDKDDDDDEKLEPKEIMKSPPKKRGRSADTVKTPTGRNSRTNSNKAATAEDDDDDDDDVTESKKNESPYFAAKSKRAKTTGKLDDDEEDDEEKEEEEEEDRDKKVAPTEKAAPAGKAAAAKKAADPKKAAPRKAALVKKGSAAQKAAGKAKTTTTTAKTKRAKKAAAKKDEEEVIVIHDDDDDDGDDNMEGIINHDDDDDDDKPFTVEYASSSRATCRRCDEIIAKGTLRIAHVPLFRGKPGFKIYRHLECNVFSEDIHSVEQIGGWRTIKRTSKKDFERLCLRIEESKLEVEKENEELQPDELVPVSFQGETRQPPKGLTANLLPFQIEGLSWMYHQEVKVPDMRGGILADEMGMGKTLQTIATILDNRPMLQHSKPGAKHPPSLPESDLEARKIESELWDNSVVAWKHEMEMNNVPKKMWRKKMQSARAGTLVICPVIALSQWKTELDKFTEPDTLTVATYHGPNRAKEFPVEKLVKYDIILTTYQVLEQDFRKMVSPNKVTCPNCGGKFKVDKLRVHLKYFCGDGARKTEAQARQQRTRNPGSNRRGGRSSSGKKGGCKSSGKGELQKKTFAKTMDKKPSTTPAKRPTTTKLQKGKGGPKGKRAPAKRGKSKTVESDSEEEKDFEMVETSPTTGRPSRSAAVTAAKRMSASMNEWADGTTKGGNEDDSFGSDRSESDSGGEDDDESLGSYDSDDSDDSVVPQRPTKKAAPKKRSATSDSSDSDDSDADDSDSEEDAALVRARKRQAAALARAKKGKGKKPSQKSKAGEKGMAKGKGKKKFRDESSSDEESDDDDSVNGDPMDGIDLKALMQEAMDGSKMSLLHTVCFWRIVLDEAHFIKSRSSQTAAAAFALIGINRWALSGTPLQNRVGELYSLIRFLQVPRMAHYFCRQKGCGCTSIHYRIKNGTCQDCNHAGGQHYSHFNKHVLNPIQRDGYKGDGRAAMFTLKNEVLDKCLLRRTKETRAEDMNLPPRIVSIRTINLHPVEKDFYDALYTQTKSSFSDYVAQGTLLNNYAHIFDLLTRMRQAVDHPYLIVYSKRNCDETAANGNRGTQPQVANGSTDCDLCHEPPTDRVVSSCCGAAFCRSCVLEYMTPALDGAGDGNTPCPSCRAPFSIDFNQAVSAVVDDSTLAVSSQKNSDGSSGPGPSLKDLRHVTSGSILRRINLAEFATSTKIEALVQELIEMRKARPGSKALVFSQFVNMLDLIRWRLHCDPCLAELGLGVRILHGSMDVKARDEALKDFREDNSVRVLLMSLKAGGVALNLTVASEVFLVDNWWNPAAEMQAIDRTHRLGQHRCIRAVRFIAEGTVEERVLQLQEKKRLVFDGTVGRDAGSLKMLTVDDMQSLFQ